MKHIVGLSGGKDSTAMALRLMEVEPRDYTFVCTPTGNEPAAMFAHWRKLGELLGKPLTPLVSGSLEGLIRKYNALPNWRQRWCTRQLKIEPFIKFVQANAPCVTYVGLRADEEDRKGTEYNSPIPGVTHDFPLQRWGWGITEVMSYNDQRGVMIPIRTDCELCFFQTLWEWYCLWRDNPEGYALGELCEQITGHTFRSPQRDTQPTSLKDLRLKFESGYVPKERRRDSLKAMQCRACTL